jgi:hypothetical protein
MWDVARFVRILVNRNSARLNYEIKDSEKTPQEV